MLGENPLERPIIKGCQLEQWEGAVGQTIRAAVVLLFLAGCASRQLNYNTLDIASAVESLYTKQVLENLSKFIDEPFATPSQLDFAAGTVQTSNSVTPTITFPLSTSVATAVGSATTKTTTIAGSSLGIGASDSWQQNWTVTPISDANTLRNLRALYRYVIYGTDLKSEYNISRMFDDTNTESNSRSVYARGAALCSLYCD